MEHSCVGLPVSLHSLIFHDSCVCSPLVDFYLLFFEVLPPENVKKKKKTNEQFHICCQLQILSREKNYRI